MFSPISELTVFGLSPELDPVTNPADQPINPPQHAYFRADVDEFVFDLHSGAGHQIVLTKDQIRAHCDHDYFPPFNSNLELKSGKQIKRASAGYGEFADNFNNERPGTIDHTEIMAHGVAAIFDPFFAAIDNPVLISVMLMSSASRAIQQRSYYSPHCSTSIQPSPHSSDALSAHLSLESLVGSTSSTSNQPVAVTAHEADLGKPLKTSYGIDFASKSESRPE